MPLILAIEPDRRQAAQLSAVVRKRVSAELILVDTTAQALDAIGDRMPDLVLVPALLSPQDDAALAGALRVIAAAARVQMLTIPVLGAARPAPRVGGMLSALRRGKSSVVQPDGCDPGVFAEQIASYLEHAALERASSGADIAADDAASWTEAAPLPDVEVAEAVEASAEAAAVAEFVDASGEIVEDLRAIEAAEDVEPIGAAPVEIAEPPMAAAADESVAIALEQAVWALFAEEAPAAEPPAEMWAETPPEMPAEPPVPVAAAAPSVPVMNEWAAVEELMAALEAMPLAAIEAHEQDDRMAPAVEDLESVVEQADWVIEDPHGDDVDLITELKGADGQPAAAGVAAGSEREWIALIESLRQDVERLRLERAEKPQQKAAKPSEAKSPKTGKKAKPVQDEWGFFDPEQCGFAALLAKLDEVTEADEGRI
jgi:hypothetical protein